MILLLKLQILSDPDRIPLTYVLVTFTDYRSAFSPTRGANKINLHDISAHNLLANYHQYQTHQTDEDEGVVLNDEDVTGTTDEAPNLLLAFLMSRGDSALPGDL